MKTRPNITKVALSDEDERKRAAIARGRADVAAGRVVDHDDVERWVESWGSEAPLTRPTPKCR